MMEKSILLPVKSDIIFRLFYADERNREFLIELLKSMLNLPDEDYHTLEIADPNLLREYEGDKLGIIDVKLYTASKKVIHIEIQLQVTPKLTNRIMYYSAKLVTEQIGSGDDYDTINMVISIIITDEVLIPSSPAYHHHFTFYDPKAGVELTNLVGIHTLELSKLPENADGTQLYDWAKFIAAETEEELNMLAERNPVIEKAVVKIRELSGDENARNLVERREKARRDHAMYVKWEREQGRQEGETKGRQEGLQQGREEGRQEGIEEGRQEGKLEGRQEGIEEVVLVAIKGHAPRFVIEMMASSVGISAKRLEELMKQGGG